MAKHEAKKVAKKKVAKKKVAKKKVAKKKVAKKKVAKKKEFKQSKGTQAKMRRLREQLDLIDTLESQLSKCKNKRDELKNELLPILQANGLESMGNGNLTLYIEKQDTYTIVDGNWHDCEKYVKKHDAFDLLHRRISVTACRERFGMKPPKFLKYKQITKLQHKRK